MKNSFIIILIFCLTSVYSQTEEVVLPEFEVKVKQESKEIRQLAASRKIVITQKEFESLGDITAGDVVKRYPGLWVQGPSGSNRNVMLCGLDKVFQSIMIDGNRPCGGESDREFKLDRIPLDTIEKIEIINIPTSDYCSDAVAGVVNLVTKKEEMSGMVNLDLAAAMNSTNNETESGKGFLSYTGNNLFLSGSFNRETRINLNYLEDSVTGIEGQEEEDCDIRITTFSGKYTYNISRDTRLVFEGLFSNFDEVRDIVQDVKLRSQGGLNYRDIVTDQDLLRRISEGGLTFSHDIERFENITSRFTYNRADDEKFKYLDEEKSEGFANTDEVEDQVNQEYMFNTDYTNLQTELFGFSNTFKTGLKLDYLLRDYNRYVETFEVNPDTLYSYENGSFDYSEIQAGIYIRDEIFIDPVIYSFGVRTEYAYYDYKVIDSVQTGNNDYYFVNPSLLLNYKINENYILKGGFSRQIARPPYASTVPIDKIKTKKNIIERGNPDILPADALTYNLGVEYYKGNDLYSVYGYFKDVNNIIEIENVGIDDATGYNIQQFVNIAEAIVWGIDLEVTTDLEKFGMKGLSFSGNYSYLGSRLIDRNIKEYLGEETYRRLNEQPEHIINAALNYRITDWIFNVGFNYTDEKVIWPTVIDNSGTLQIVPKTITDEMFQLDASVKYSVMKNMLLYLNINNIMDEDVTVIQDNVTGIEPVGIRYTLGLKYGIGGK